jgi:DNA-binding transcriptional MocR family regulator
MHVIRHYKVLAEGRSARSMVREVGVSRNTVRKYLEQAEHAEWRAGRQRNVPRQPFTRAPRPPMGPRPLGHSPVQTGSWAEEPRRHLSASPGETSVSVAPNSALFE